MIRYGLSCGCQGFTRRSSHCRVEQTSVSFKPVRYARGVFGPREGCAWFRIWKTDCELELERAYRTDRQSGKRYCLRPRISASASDTCSQLLGLDVKLQCNVSRSTFRCKLAGPEASKQEIENFARQYWLKVLVTFLVEAKLPICDLAEQTSEPQLVFERAFGSRRMRTLRSRARSWKKVVSWMDMFRGSHRPRHVADRLDYLVFLRQEGASRGQIDGV